MKDLTKYIMAVIVTIVLCTLGLEDYDLDGFF